MISLAACFKIGYLPVGIHVRYVIIKTAAMTHKGIHWLK